MEEKADISVAKKTSKAKYSLMASNKWASSYIVLVFILLIGGLATVKSPYFMSPGNMSNLFLQLVPIALVALGQSFVILLGGIDLSVGPLMSLTTTVASYLIVSENYAAGIVICLFIGILTGLINGTAIVYLKLPDFVTTLATYSALAGLALIIRPTGGGSISSQFMQLASSNIFTYIPVAAIFMLILYVAFEVLLQKTKPGTYLYATGSSSEAAFIAGIRTNAVKVAAYTLCGLLASVAGMILASRIGSGDPQVGTSFTMTSITAVVIGGISLTGGRGIITGTLLGSFLIILMQNALNLLHISAYFQYVWIGVLTLLSVALYSMPAMLKKAGKA